MLKTGGIVIALLLSVFNQIMGQSPYMGAEPYASNQGGLIINEMSQGTSGQEEYIEFVVLGAPDDPTAPVDLSGYIFDDNNVPSSGNATSEGHFRFGDCYNAVPPGSIFVIYNVYDINPAVPPADPEDMDGDGVYIIPINDSCIDNCDTNPTSAPPGNQFHCPCESEAPFNEWESIVMRNGGDLIQVRDDCGTLLHIVNYGTQSLTSEVGGSPVFVNTGFGSQSGSVISFTHDVDDNWINPSNFSEEPTPGGETPGAPNNPENETFIQSISDGSFDYEGTIAHCDQADAGRLEWPADGDPGGPGILEICEGEDIGAFGPDWSAPGDEEPDGSKFEFEYGYILTESDPPHEILEYNLSGDFDFSSYPPGTYRVWGMSFLYVNGEEDLNSFLGQSCFENIDDVLDYANCDYDCGVVLDLSNQSTYDDDVIIEILEGPDPPTDPMIPDICENEAQNYDLTQWVDDIQNGSSHQVEFYDGDPENGGTLIADPADVDLSSIGDLWIFYGEAPCQIAFDLQDPMILDVPSTDPVGPYNICFPAGNTSQNIDLTQYENDINNTPGTTFTWYEDMGLNSEITTPFSYNIPEGTTTLYVTASNGNCTSDPLEVEFEGNPSPTINTGVELEGCEPAPDEFDLTEAEIDLNGMAGMVFEWYEDPQGQNPIPTPESFLSSGGNVYVSVQDPSTGCYSDTVSVSLILNPAPTFNVPNEVTVCEGLEVELDTLIDPSNPNLTYTFHSGTPPTTGNQIVGPTTFNSNTTVYVVGTDDNTGCSTTEAVDVEVIDIPASPPISNTGPYCEGETIELNYDFPIPIPGLQFEWTGPNGFSSTEENPTLPNATSANAGDYILVVSLQGCSSNPATTTVEVTDLPQISTTSPLEVCEGESIQLNVSGPPNAQYNWTGPNGFSSTQQNPTVTNEASPGDAGIYTVEGSLNGCTGDPVNLEVIVLEEPDFTLEIVDEIQCNGDDNGSIQVNINNPNPPMTFEWSDPNYNGLDFITNLSAGTYTVTVTDGNGCSASDQIELTAPDPINLFCTEFEEVSAPGAEDGIGLVEILGGTETFSIEYDNNNGNSGTLMDLTSGIHQLSNLAPGTYEVLVTDAYGCTAECTFTINDPDCEVSIDDISIEELIYCHGDSTAVVEAQVSGGSGTYLFSWENAAGEEISVNNPLENVPGGNYVLVVSDAFDTDCQRSQSFTIDEPPAVMVECNVLNHASGPNVADGEAEISFSGGVGPPWNFIIQSPGATDTLTFASSPILLDTLPPGIYEIQILDFFDCSASCSFEITSESCELSIDSLVLENSLSCKGDSTASLRAVLSGNEGGNSTHHWTTHPAGDTLSDLPIVDQLPEGTYVYTYNDSLCFLTDTITINAESTLELLECNAIQTSTDTSNPNGAALISWVGNAPDYTLTWDGPVSGTTTLANDSLLIDSLEPGTYQVAISDSLACTDSCTFEISACDLSIAIDTFWLSDPCQYDSSLVILLDTGNLGPNTVIIYETDTLTGDTVRQLSPGTHVFYAIDTNSACIDSVIFTFDPVPLFEWNCGVERHPSAPGVEDGALQLVFDTIRSPYDLQISGPVDSNASGLALDTFTLESLPEGQYNIIVTDSLGCTDSCSVELIPNACNLELTLDSVGYDGCPSDSNLTVSLELSGQLAPPLLLWNGDTSQLLTRSQLPQGNYEIIAIDTASQCRDTLQFTETNNSRLDFGCIVFRDISTQGASDGRIGMVPDSISSPYELWLVSSTGDTLQNQQSSDPDSVVFGNLPAGSYRIIVENIDGCIDSCNVTLDSIDCSSLQFQDISLQQPSCNPLQSGAITVTIEGGSGNFNYLWTPDSLPDQSMVTDLLPGSYSVTVTDSQNGCTIDTSLLLDDPGMIEADIQFPSSICPGDSASVLIDMLSGAPPFRLSIDGMTSTEFFNDTSIILPGGSYSFNIVDANGCSESRDLQISELPPASVLIDSVLCPGDSLVVAGQIFDQSEPIGSVIISGGSQNGCDSTINVNLSFQPVTVEFSTIPARCPDELQTRLEILSVSGPAPHVLLIEGDSLEIQDFPFTYSSSDTGRISFQLSASDDCLSDTLSYLSEQIRSPELSITGEDRIIPGDTTLLTAETNSPSGDFQWQPSSFLSCDSCASTLAFPPQSQNYSLLLTDSNQCTAEASIFITVSPPSDEVYIPNVFSPDQNNINDHFTLFDDGTGTIATLQIYDRWGDLLYEARNLTPGNQGWDGSSNNRDLPPGVYVYRIEYIAADGQAQVFSGSVTLLR